VNDFAVQTIIGHGVPRDARSSRGARPPCDRCPTAARYARGEVGQSATGTGRSQRPRARRGQGVQSEGVLHAFGPRGIKPATLAHIHKGRKGVAGPVVVPTDGSSFNPPRPTSSGCEAISKKLSMKLRHKPSHYYVNVHNKPYPEGAIRGQLRRSR
jgi:hypothetical protein